MIQQARQHDVTQRLQSGHIDHYYGPLTRTLPYTTPALEMPVQWEISDGQTPEGSPLDAFLERPYVPKWSRRAVAIHRPEHLLPSRWEVIDRIMAKHGHCPDPNLEIVCDAIFAYSTIPTTGKLYIDCYFIDCNLEIADGYWELIDSVVEGGVMWAQIWDGKGGATVKGNVRI